MKNIALLTTVTGLLVMSPSPCPKTPGDMIVGEGPEYEGINKIANDTNTKMEANLSENSSPELGVWNSAVYDTLMREQTNAGSDNNSNTEEEKNDYRNMIDKDDDDLKSDDEEVEEITPANHYVIENEKGNKIGYIVGKPENTGITSYNQREKNAAAIDLINQGANTIVSVSKQYQVSEEIKKKYPNVQFIVRENVTK